MNIVTKLWKWKQQYAKPVSIRVYFGLYKWSGSSFPQKLELLDFKHINNALIDFDFQNKDDLDLC